MASHLASFWNRGLNLGMAYYQWGLKTVRAFFRIIIASCQFSQEPKTLCQHKCVQICKCGVYCWPLDNWQYLSIYGLIYLIFA